MKKNSRNGNIVKKGNGVSLGSILGGIIGGIIGLIISWIVVAVVDGVISGIIVLWAEISDQPEPNGTLIIIITIIILVLGTIIGINTGSKIK